MDSNGRAALACSIVFPLLALFTTIGRFCARGTKKANIGADDIIIACDTLLVLGYGALVGWASFDAGIGGIDQLDLSVLTRYLKNVFSGELLNITIIGTIKIAILVFYKRIFIRRGLHIIANVLIFIIAAWTIAFFFSVQRYPVQYNWELDAPPSPVQGDVLYVTCGTIDVVLDLCVITLPIPQIRSLNLSPRRRILLTSIFLLGAFAVISSAVRLGYFVSLLIGDNTSVAFHENPYTNISFNMILWSMIESNTSIVAANLPTLGPLLTSEGTIRSLIRKASSVFSHNSSEKLPMGASENEMAASDGMPRSDSDSTGQRAFRPGESAGSKSNTPTNLSADGRKWRHVWNGINKDHQVTITSASANDVESANK